MTDFVLRWVPNHCSLRRRASGIALLVNSFHGFLTDPNRQVNYLIADGKSHWLEGVLLMTLY